jgi:hypothetical protein
MRQSMFDAARQANRSETTNAVYFLLGLLQVTTAIGFGFNHGHKHSKMRRHTTDLAQTNVASTLPQPHD